MIRIDDKEVFFSGTFVAKHRHTVTFTAAPDTVLYRLTFNTAGGGDPLSWSVSEDGVIEMVMVPPASASCSAEPFRIGTRPNGAPIYLQFAAMTMGDASHVQIYLLVGTVPTNPA